MMFVSRVRQVRWCLVVGRRLCSRRRLLATRFAFGLPGGFIRPALVAFLFRAGLCLSFHKCSSLANPLQAIVTLPKCLRQFVPAAASQGSVLLDIYPVGLLQNFGELRAQSIYQVSTRFAVPRWTDSGPGAPTLP